MNISLAMNKKTDMYSEVPLQHYVWVHRNGGMDHVISELCYKGTNLHRNYRKMTMLWSFSYNSFVKFHGKKSWQPQHDSVMSKNIL